MRLNCKKTWLFAFACWSQLPWCGLRAAEPDPSNMDCVVEMEIPRYTALARLAIKTGTVESRVLIGLGGKIDSIKTKSPDPPLGEEVEAFLRAASFRPECHGKEVVLLFTYELEGEPRSYPYAKIRFRPPNHFFVLSQPGTPHIYIDPRVGKPVPGSSVSVGTGTEHDEHERDRRNIPK